MRGFWFGITIYTLYLNYKRWTGKLDEAHFWEDTLYIYKADARFGLEWGCKIWFGLVISRVRYYTGLTPSLRDKKSKLKISVRSNLYNTFPEDGYS